MKNRMSVLWGALIVSMLSGCDSFAKDDAAVPAGPPPAAVTVVTVAREDVPVNFEYVGQVESSLQVEIRNRITGIIQKRHFTEGASVKAGQLLFSIDDEIYRAQYQQALAAIDIAKAQLVSAEAQLKKAQRELKRVTPLASQQMLSQNQEDDAMSAVDIAKAENTVAEAAIKQAEANLLSAKINLQYTQIKSPIDGVAGRSLQNRGTLVQANTLLTTLVKLNPVYVNFGIPENERIRLRHQQRSGELSLPDSGFNVDVRDANGQLQKRNGKLDFEDYKVDNQTGNFSMRATLDNTDKTLSPGQFVRVVLTGAHKTSAVAIPQRAVLDGTSGKYVYVVSAGPEGSQIAMQRSIVPGEWVSLGADRDNYWIIESGLEPGDQVIVDGVARIFFPGQPVMIDSADAADPAAAS